MKETFFQIAIQLTIIMFLFTLVIGYVNGLGLYGVDYKAGNIEGETGNEKLKSVTEQEDYQSGIGVDLVFTLVLTGAGIGGLVVAWFTHSTAVLGVFLFSACFWVSYGNMINVINAGSFIPFGFLAIGTAGMGFIWIGAVAGMLSGSG